MISTIVRFAVLNLTLFVSAVFAEDTSSSELSAKALFYKTSGEIAQVETSPANQSTAGRESLAAGGKKTTIGRADHATKRTQSAQGQVPLALRASVLLAGDAGKTVEVRPSYKFNSGDRIKLAFSTNKAGYFYLATIGSTGAVQILAPRVGEPVRVEAGNRYTFPSNPAGFFRFDSTKGKEEIWAVLSDSPLSAINMGSGLVAQLPQHPTAATGELPVSDGKVVKVANVSDELSGKDLVFEEDATALFTSAKPTSLEVSLNNKPPVIVKLVLQHQ